MTPVFADTCCWIALSYSSDENHDRAVAWNGRLGDEGRSILTTEEVFVEYLTFFSDKGGFWRARAAAIVEELRRQRNIEVLAQTSASFQGGVDLYALRLDKSYSLTDCIAMQVMRRERLAEALTNDRHFEQEGFVALLRQDP